MFDFSSKIKQERCQVLCFITVRINNKPFKTEIRVKPILSCFITVNIYKLFKNKTRVIATVSGFNQGQIFLTSCGKTETF